MYRFTNCTSTKCTLFTNALLHSHNPNLISRSVLCSIRSFPTSSATKAITMQKRKITIPPNADSATINTDASDEELTKRLRILDPLPAAVPGRTPSIGDTAKITENGAPGEAVKEEPERFDHSRPEERAGIVDRRYYPAEISNERCEMYNANKIPRPIEVLEKTLHDTHQEREDIRFGKNGSGDAVVHWFKRDLRIRDNTGLSKAAELAKERGVGVIGVWLMSPQDWEAHLVSPAKCDFELRSVDLLKKELEEMDIPLYIETIPERKNVTKRLVELTQEWNVKNVFCNLEYEADELRREERLVRMMLENGVCFDPYHDDCVVPPGTLKNSKGEQHTVFMSWSRAWIAHLQKHPGLLKERPIPGRNPANFREKFNKLFNSSIPSPPESKALTPEEKERFSRLWPAGEAAAIDRLQHFLKEKVLDYKKTRNFPAQNGTSRVSAHHAAGTLAARSSIRMARDVNRRKKLNDGMSGIKTWIVEVSWRDFYRHVLVHWPYVCMNKPLKYEFSNIKWEHNPEHFTAWTQGRTGYPIVDAAMRCLNSTGYMHNRLRMITASFLANHLLLDWRLGEQYFMTHLIDGDFASNNGGWGFSSSTGVESNAYLRLLNPWVQSQKFDAEGEFIRQWVEELKDVEGKDVLNPYGEKSKSKAGEVARQRGYPKPIVEHAAARARCFERYKEGVGRDFM
ncbi:deoxyribodipyrimidine photo-lyase [Pyrenophora seminiperda CCB06]|uniref:Deoxyribodipyrimidine photo-lyase n=1 Tax=Pyrenophora seminiperda CCB06 TaxID=1302712 RepID=A0A3M7M247_9PLEO|nr:deoxyribodipyrimidine photo-lyase [Pyrenophora seminiperda CCB06]